jgi:hypothetical protein
VSVDFAARLILRQLLAVYASFRIGYGAEVVSFRHPKVAGMNASDSRLLKFYEKSTAERARLVRREGQLEFVRTKELLDRFLPRPRARIIDIGGGTGAYSSWLASLGHSVHLVDVVPGHVEEASRDRMFTAIVGDARALPASDGQLLRGALTWPAVPFTGIRGPTSGASGSSPGCPTRRHDRSRIHLPSRGSVGRVCKGLGQ